MKTTVRNILIALAVLAVLGAVAAVLLLTAPAETEEPESSSEAETVKLVDYTAEDVASIDFASSELSESFTLVPFTEETESSSSVKFTIEGWENEDVNTSSVTTFAGRLYSMTSIRELGEVEDLSEYGLSGDGKQKIVLHLTDGKSVTLLVGIQAGESSGRYVLKDGKVYIASMASTIDDSKFDYLNLSNLIAIEDPNPSEAESVLQTVSYMEHLYLSGSNFPEEIKITYDPENIQLYYLNEPYYSGANTTVMDSVMDALQHVSAKSAVAVQATDEELAAYGLDQPTAVADFVINGEAHVIKLGRKEDNAYYATIDNGSVIYTLAASDVSIWAETDAFTLRDSFVALIPIQNVSRLTLTGGGSTETYDVAREIDEDRTTETSTVYNYFPSRDGKDVSYEDAYQPLYKSLLAVYVLNEEPQEPAGEELLRIRFEFYDGSEPSEVVYYADPNEPRRCVAVLNGAPCAIVRSSEVQTVLDGKATLAAGGVLKEDD